MKALTIFLMFISPILGFFSSIGSSSVANNSKYDLERKDAITSFMDAANSFQANNNGKTPWTDGNGTSTKFVKRYIDASCDALTPDKEDNTCTGDFRDPDGTPFHFVYHGSLNSDKTVSVGKDHGIHVYTTAICNGKHGELAKRGGARQYVMLYKLDSGEIYCVDNH